MKKRERYINKAVVLFLILTLSIAIVPVASADTDYAITGMEILLEGSGNNATLTVKVHVNNPTISNYKEVELWLKATDWTRVDTEIATESPVTLTYNWGGSAYDDGNSHAVKVILNATDNNDINNVLETIIPIGAWDEAFGWYFSLQLWLDSNLRNLPAPVNWLANLPVLPIVIFLIVLVIVILWWRSRRKKGRQKYFKPPLPSQPYR